ncbi:MAG: hypothetical protein WDO16_01925 [Bacteroidota bacterium]
MNKFGGNWTEKKIEILVEYAKAYLDIMNVYANRYSWKLLYFDGFAGLGEIIKVIDNKLNGNYDVSLTIGAARRIVEIEDPRPFDEYYFVEKNFENFKQLENSTKKAFPKKKYSLFRKIVIRKCLILQIISETLKTSLTEPLHILIRVECK